MTEIDVNHDKKPLRIWMSVGQRIDFVEYERFQAYYERHIEDFNDFSDMIISLAFHQLETEERKEASP